MSPSSGSAAMDESETNVTNGAHVVSVLPTRPRPVPDGTVNGSRVERTLPEHAVPEAAATLAEDLLGGEPAKADARYDPAAVAVVALLEALGVPRSEHTADTPGRVARAWRFALRGYCADPRRHLTVTFPCEPGAPLVVQAGIRITSTCAHHLLPIVGVATVAYRPSKGARIVGLSKLARVVTEYAARATVQEHIGGETARALAEMLSVDGAACVITAEHGCMSLRGVEQAEARTTTTSLAGKWTATHPDVAEVLAAHRAEAHRR